MKIVTACTLDCPDGCSLVVERGPGERVRIKGNPDHPFTAGFCCAKIKRWPARLASPNRITSPLVKDGAGWRRVGWEEALDLCAARIQALRRTPLAVLQLDSGGNHGLLRRVVRHFFVQLGASLAQGSLCDDAGIVASEQDMGFLHHNDLTDLLQARTIVNWGRDVGRMSVHLAALVQKARRRGARMLTVSPGGDGHEAWSDEFIRVRPGADRHLAAAVIQRLMERGRTRADLDRIAANWPAFSRLVLARPAVDLAAVCGVGLAEVDRLAELYGQAEPVASLIAWGLQRHPYGGENVRFINALGLISGHLGRSGGGVYFNIASARNYNLAWQAQPRPEQTDRFLWPTLGRDLLAAAGPAVGLVWVNGANPVNQVPDSLALAKALAAVPFKVVVEAFLTDTAKLADLILPCVMNLEEENLNAAASHNFVNYARPAFDPPAGARTDQWIVAQLGQRLDPPLPLPEDEEILRWSLASPTLGATLEDLRARGFAQAKWPAVAFADLRFGHPDGRYRFPEELHPEPAPPQGYPLRLLSLIRKEAIHSQILPEEQEAPPLVHLAPESPAWTGLDPGRPVFLASPQGRLLVRPRPAPGQHPEVVVYRRGDWLGLGGGVNQLIAPGLTDVGETATYYAQWVRLEN